MERQYMSPLPIRTFDASHHTDAARHRSMVSLVDQMLELHKAARCCSNQSREDRAQAPDRGHGQIDRLVYELYGLTEEEIGIVEPATR
ncbi:MAG: hypothetical protein HGA93_00245 [Methanothrix sp.]|nr:hypothetical protein [Methanothrix sp.]